MPGGHDHGSSSSRLLTILAVFALAAAALGAPSNAQGGGTLLYGVIGDQLVTIDPATAAVTVVGPTGLAASPAINALAYHTMLDTLFGIRDPAGTPELYSFDRSTGAATLVGALSGGGLALDRAEGFAYDAVTDTLYAAGGTAGSSDRILTVDAATGAATHVTFLDTSTRNDEFDGIEFVGGTLYGLDAISSTRNADFGTADTATGAITLIGIMGAPNPNDMAYDPASDTLYTIANNDALEGQRMFYIIDRSTAALTFVGQTHTTSEFGGASLRSLAFAPDGPPVPIPELGTLVLVGAGILGIAALTVVRRRT